MYQGTVYLDDQVIMRDAMMVEPDLQGVHLTTAFELMQIVPAAIRRIDPMKHQKTRID